MTTTKVENYTKAMTAKMIQLYTAVGTGMTEADHDKRAQVVKELGAEFKKNDRSIRSKLVREEIYIKRTATSTVTNEKPAKKDAMAVTMVEAAGNTSGVSKLVLNPESIEKMNKTEIAICTAQFNALHAEIEALNADLNSYCDEFGELPQVLGDEAGLGQMANNTDVETENQGEDTA